ncbi:hypothetical protein D3C71_548550 [compost metagenome]
MEKPTCYILSGLGADERVFDQIDFGPFFPVFIPWEPLTEPNQSFESYVKQLSIHVKTPHPILIGISFGGIVAQEMSALLNNCPVLILASIRTRAELPLWMKAGGKIGLQKMIPIKKLLKNKKGNHWFFGTKTQEEKIILDQILADSDPLFTKWAIHQIVSWKRKTTVSSKVLHIHGTKDRIFHIKKLHPDYMVEGGTHFMTVSKHDELSKIIREALDKLSLINQE